MEERRKDMMDHEACKDCVLRSDCLFRKSDDVESCGDVIDAEQPPEEDTSDKV